MSGEVSCLAGEHTGAITWNGLSHHDCVCLSSFALSSFSVVVVMMVVEVLRDGGGSRRLSSRLLSLSQLLSVSSCLTSLAFRIFLSNSVSFALLESLSLSVCLSFLLYLYVCH